MTDWTNPTRKPRPYEPVTVQTEKGEEFHGLCWSKARAEFIEPISNRSAEPVIGKITGWRYPDLDPGDTPEP
jgi:hypothetical protein